MLAREFRHPRHGAAELALHRPQRHQERSGERVGVASFPGSAAVVLMQHGRPPPVRHEVPQRPRAGECAPVLRVVRVQEQAAADPFPVGEQPGQPGVDPPRIDAHAEFQFQNGCRVARRRHAEAQPLPEFGGIFRGLGARVHAGQQRAFRRRAARASDAQHVFQLRFRLHQHRQQFGRRVRAAVPGRVPAEPGDQIDMHRFGAPQRVRRGPVQPRQLLELLQPDAAPALLDGDQSRARDPDAVRRVRLRDLFRLPGATQPRAEFRGSDGGSHAAVSAGYVSYLA